MEKRLESNGWFLKDDTLKHYSNETSLETVVSQLLNQDLKRIGRAWIQADSSKGLASSGKGVVQVQKVRNICGPKDRDLNSEPRLLKVVVTDGSSNIVGIEFEPLPFRIKVGNKLYLNNVPVRSGFLLLTRHNCRQLGGAAVATDDCEDDGIVGSGGKSISRFGQTGAPPWVPFGRRIAYEDDGDFKALADIGKTGSGGGDNNNADFEQQRQAQIRDLAAKSAEASAKTLARGGANVESLVESLQTNMRMEADERKARRDERRRDRRDQRQAERRAENEVDSYSSRPQQTVNLLDYVSLTSTEGPQLSDKIGESGYGAETGRRGNRGGGAGAISMSNRYDQPPSADQDDQRQSGPVERRAPRNEGGIRQKQRVFGDDDDNPSRSAGAGGWRGRGRSGRAQRHQQPAQQRQSGRPTSNRDGRRQYGGTMEGTGFGRQTQSFQTQASASQSYPAASARFPTAAMADGSQMQVLTDSDYGVLRAPAQSLVPSLLGPHDLATNTDDFLRSNKINAEIESRPSASRQTTWKVGDFCLAKYSADGQLYKAVISAVSAQLDQVLVTFLGYGNNEEVRLCDVRPLPKTYYAKH